MLTCHGDDDNGKVRWIGDLDRERLTRLRPLAPVHEMLSPTAVAPTVARIVDAVERALFTGGHAVPLRCDDVDSRSIAPTEPDERRELAAV